MREPTMPSMPRRIVSTSGNSGMIRHHPFTSATTPIIDTFGVAAGAYALDSHPFAVENQRMEFVTT
jgi:hypothetical protein